MTSSGLPAVAHGRWARSLRGEILSGPAENDTMSQRRVPLADLVLAVALAAAGVAIAQLIDPHMRPGTRLDAWGAVLIVAAAPALAVRRRWRWPSAAAGPSWQWPALRAPPRCTCCSDTATARSS